MKKPIHKNTFVVLAGNHPLCFRCEHRARWNETKQYRPRCECGDTGSGKHSCYMYEPVKPLVLEIDQGEKRPPFIGYAFSGRSHAVGLPLTKIRILIANKKMVLFHVPAQKRR